MNRLLLLPLLALLVPVLSCAEEPTFPILNLKAAKAIHGSFAPTPAKAPWNNWAGESIEQSGVPGLISCLHAVSRPAFLAGKWVRSEAYHCEISGNAFELGGLLLNGESAVLRDPAKVALVFEAMTQVEEKCAGDFCTKRIESSGDTIFSCSRLTERGIRAGAHVMCYIDNRQGGRVASGR